MKIIPISIVLLVLLSVKFVMTQAIVQHASKDTMLFLFMQHKSYVCHVTHHAKIVEVPFLMIVMNALMVTFSIIQLVAIHAMHHA